MVLKRCQNCEKIIGNLEEPYFYQGHVVCKKCENILDKQAGYFGTSEGKSCNEAPEERKPNNKISYIRKHWRGQLSLAVSFWINLFLLNIVILLFWALLGYGEILKNPVISARVIIIFMALYLLIIYPWQFIGLWRSCNRHIKINGKRFWARTAQVLVVLSLIVSLGNLRYYWPIYRSSFQIAFVKDSECGNYTLTLEKNNTLLHLQGGLGYGVSKDVSKILKANPKVEGIILDSIGGYIYEGRELAKLISAYGLDTYSIKGCYSAATIAFIAGEKRFLAMGANLAYHQYKSYEGFDKFGDMEEEQEEDLLCFEQRGVKSEFLKKMFGATPDDLWYPTIDEMIDAGVIHGIVNPSDLLPIEYTSKEIAEASLEIEEAMLEIPVYRTIKKYAPDAYDKIKETLSDKIEKGTTLIEIQHAGTTIIQSLAFGGLSQTSDEALIQFAQTLVVALKKLREIAPILCMKALYPQQYGSVVFREYLSDEESYLVLEALNKIIVDAYEKDNPPVDTESAELLIYELALELGEYADYLELGDLKGSEDYGRHCDAVIILYESILKEDKRAAGNLLRYMLSSE